MTKEEIIESCKNSLNIYSFTAEALEKLIDAVRVEPYTCTKDLTDDELNRLRHNIDWTAEWSYVKFARAVIAKLREKERQK